MPLAPDTAILQVVPALDAGGVERTTVDVARAIVDAGGRAIIASRGGRLEGELAEAGARLVRLPPLDAKDPWTLWRNARALERLARDEGVRLIHARSRAPAWSALLAARRLRLPLVTTYAGRYNAASHLKRGYNSVMARGDLVIANSEWTREHLLGEHPATDPARVIAIPRGIDLARFDPDAVTPGRVAAARLAMGLAPDERRPVLLLAGRLTRWKGQALAIEALARSGADAVLVLAGDDQGRAGYRAELQRLAAERGMGERVRLPGHLDDMPAAYLAASYTLAPSLEPEAFGRTAVEPQAMGTPVLAADHGAPRETMEPGVSGWRVPPGDLEAWAAAIARALALDPDHRARMGAAGRARVRRLYALRAMTDATLAAYAHLLDAWPGRGTVNRILVIRLAALGDFVQATGPMRRIRDAHPAAEITLLTTPPYAALGLALGLFDAVDEGGRPATFAAQLALARRLRAGRFDRVYDLQTSDRSSALRMFFWPRTPEWSGIARGASHPHRNPDRDRMHTLERQADQLHDAGIWPDAPTAPGSAPAPDLGFMPDDAGAPARFGLPARYALLAPGTSPKRPAKRWPAPGWTLLARALAEAGIAPAVVGGPAEVELGAEIAAGSGVLSVAGTTSFADLAALGRRATLAVSNDTGPAHLLAAAGAPTLVLFGPDSDPALCAPRARVEVLRAPSLAELDAETVTRAALALLAYGS